MRNIKLISLALLTTLGMSVFAQTGQYSTRAISADGKTSTWTFDVVSGSAQTIADGTEDNGIVYVNGGGANKAQTSKYMSFNKSEVYIEVPSGSAGSISMVVYSSSDSRWFQLFINGTSGPETQRLWSKAGDGTDGKKGPQTFTFTSTDITTSSAKTYLHLKTNGTEMKLKSFTITLTSGSYSGSTPPEPEKSHDATLKSLTYGSDNTSVPGFKADQLNYEVELPVNYVGGAPSVQAEKNDAKADVDVTQATTLPGTAKIDVTAEDGETKRQYTVTFTKESADPKVESATWANIKGTAAIDQVNKTITGQVTNGSSLTLEPQFTGKNIAGYTPNGAQNFANGTISYTFTSSTNETTTYQVTITETPAASSDATLKSLKYNGTSVPNFSPNTLIYNIELPKGTTTPPTVTAEKNDAKAQAPDITQAPTLPGTATVVVIAEDGTTSLTYTINFTVEVPQSGLKTHEPGIYEASKADGGYNTALTVVGGREYEVYYTERTADGDFPTFSTTLATDGKATGISGSTSKTKNEGREGDKWFEGTIYSHSECKNASSEGEFVFESKKIREHRLGASDTYQFKVQGYDQFSLWGMDKKLDAKKGDSVLVVKVDGIRQPIDHDIYNKDKYTIRRYTITPGEHLIEISTTCTGSDVCYMGGFSLRVAQVPRVMYIDGNDSSQVVKAGRELEPIYYYTKYNKFGETRLIWDGEEGTGVGLSIYNSDAVGDSIVLSGTPVCPAGEYNYRVESYTADGVMTKSISGKFSVIYEISFNNEEDTIAEAYQGEEMDYPIVFNYYAQSADDISLEWEGNAPEGIIGKGSNGRYTITGTPTTLGTYKYTISVAGGNSLQGQISVIELNLGEHPILYLQNRRYGYKDDGIYSYLKEQKGYNLVQRVTKDGLRTAAQYEQYDWILISEDVNADNGEVLAIARGEANRPVLNMKSFSYAPNRLDWGKPDNGSITDEGRFITVARGDHPIFKNWKHNGDKIQILNQINRKGLMPVEINYNGTLCLATALMRDTNYYKDGDPATFLHEVPADMRNGYKYICMPIALNSSNELASDGKKLLEKVIVYLQNDEATVEPTELEIKSFLIDTIAGVIDNMNNTITFDINRSLFDDIETFLSAVVPTVTLADPKNSYLIPDPNEPIDMNWTKWIPLTITVTDHVSQRVYTIIINLWSMEGIEEVYTAGDWVNVFDIYGRKIATTNEDVYSMALPHGMYVVVTENGQTLKIMR